MGTPFPLWKKLWERRSQAFPLETIPGKEPVAAASSPSVSGSPGVRMGVSADAVPVPEVEPEDPTEANNIVQKRRATRVDINHDRQHGSFCLKMLQAMSIQKSWKLVGN